MHTRPKFRDRVDAVRYDARDRCAASRMQSQVIRSEYVMHRQAQGSSKWQAMQMKLLQALTPLSSKQESKLPDGKSDEGTVPIFGDEAHSSIFNLPTASCYDIAGNNGSTSSRYKDISTLLSVLEMPQPTEQTETRLSNRFSLSVILRFDHTIGRA